MKVIVIRGIKSLKQTMISDKWATLPGYLSSHYIEQLSFITGTCLLFISSTLGLVFFLTHLWASPAQRISGSHGPNL